MYTNPIVPRRVLCLIAIFLTLASSTSFAGVRSIRSRQLLNDPVIETYEYAKISPSTLLKNTILRVQIDNDQQEAAELMVVFSIEIDVPSSADSADLSWDGTMEINLYPVIPIGESLTIDNTTIIANLDDYMSFGFDGFSGSFGPDGNTSPGNLDFTDLDMGDTAALGEFINQVLVLPEGEYTIAFHIYEKDYTSAQDDYSEDRGAEEVTFKVVDIGGLTISETPQIDDLSIGWELPEIPDYHDNRKTTSVITITEGNDELYSISIEHDPPNGQGIKGYPGDTDEGAMTLDLSDEGIPFRAGEQYTLSLAYLDWHGEPIAADMDKTFDFEGFELSYTKIDKTLEELSVELEWDAGSYGMDDWIESYDLYLDGRKITETDDTTFELDEGHLSFGTSYDWYVIPRYASDGKPFETNTSERGGFSVKEHDAPRVNIASMKDSDTFFYAREYDFVAEAQGFDEATIVSYDWVFGVIRLQGETVKNTLWNRTSDFPISCQVTDSLDMTSAKETIYVSVIDPDFMMRRSSQVLKYKAESEEYPEMTVEIVSYPIDPIEVIWSIDDKRIVTSEPELTHTYRGLGEHEIFATARYEDSYGNVLEVDHDTKVTVIDADLGIFAGEMSQPLMLPIPSSTPYTQLRPEGASVPDMTASVPQVELPTPPEFPYGQEPMGDSQEDGDGGSGGEDEEGADQGPEQDGEGDEQGASGEGEGDDPSGSDTGGPDPGSDFSQRGADQPAPLIPTGGPQPVDTDDPSVPSLYDREDGLDEEELDRMKWTPRIGSPMTGESFDWGEPIPLNGIAPEGSPTAYVWEIDGEEIALSDTLMTSISSLSEGEHLIRLYSIVDSYQRRYTSEPVQIIVNPRRNFSRGRVMVVERRKLGTVLRPPKNGQVLRADGSKSSISASSDFFEGDEIQIRSGDSMSVFIIDSNKSVELRSGDYLWDSGSPSWTKTLPAHVVEEAKTTSGSIQGMATSIALIRERAQEAEKLAKASQDPAEVGRELSLTVDSLTEARSIRDDMNRILTVGMRNTLNLLPVQKAAIENSMRSINEDLQQIGESLRSIESHLGEISGPEGVGGSIEDGPLEAPLPTLRESRPTTGSIE